MNVQDPDRVAKTGRTSGAVSLLQGTSLSVGASQASSLEGPSSLGRHNRRCLDATIPAYIFAENVRPLAIDFKLPESDERLSTTSQLAYCLYLLDPHRSPDDILDPAAYNWLNAVEDDVDEQDRLKTMVREVIRAFKRDELKDAKVVAEVMYLAPILNKDFFQDLLGELYSGIDHSGLLKFHQLEGLAQLIQGADQGHLSADDLVKILGLLSDRLQNTHQQSS